MPRPLTDQECRDEYADMVLLMVHPDWPQKIESRILAKGRTEMQSLLTYLFTRCVKADIERYQRVESAGGVG